MKVLKFFLSLILMFTLFGSVAMASPASPASNIKSKHKSLMLKVRTLVEKGLNEEAMRLPEVRQLKAEFSMNKQQESDFIKSLDANNPRLVKEKMKNIKVNSNERKVIPFDDGSFIVLENKTEKVTDQVQALDTFNTTIGKEWTTNAKYEIWGMYLAAEYHLISVYNVYSGHTEIKTTAVTGTKAYFPTTVSSATSQIVTNNSRTNVTRGDYTQIDGVSIGGQTIGFTHFYSLTTTITVNYAGNGNINFSVSSTWSG
ncbi:hypothetical protein [Paenibacillus xylaniclasticus]|uniref:hypothetical protein n=1 Tax=Paenibacillus xylaniclasticus TaxID=588083 RepID=UPI000FDB184A|nr:MULTISPECIES: hypothetical protein [Paenibacillus]GFN33974.1 hypothetical protein PCURB6_42340 [Paenibacillus curdlanolyticus]